MINSELREYATGIISRYSNEYPYYFMCTNTNISNNYSNQYGCTIFLSKTEPSALSSYSFSSDEWLKIQVYSSNANSNDNSERFYSSVVKGIVSCNDYEFVYSNIQSQYAYSSVDVFNPCYFSVNTLSTVYSVIMCACLVAGVISIWLKR